ncbi:MAG TPA: VWA domain-containing protein [Gemmataceae bacterium]|nr:VWA domain-containing protein [Gemmataceae bacterium]
MFHFAHPYCLLLALLVPPLLWWLLRKRRTALRHPAADGLDGLPLGRARFARWGGAALYGLSLLLLAAALAGPRWPDLRTRLDTDGIALMLVVDVSGSMEEPDFEWDGKPITRLEAVKRVFHLFVAGGAGEDAPEVKDAAAFEGRPTDLIGLVTFATRPETTCPLTLSHSVLLRLLKAEEARRVPGESETNLSDAITVGLHRLQAAGPRRKVLVLLTDGEHNEVSPRSDWTPRQAAQVAVSLGVPIYAIDAGGLGAGRGPSDKAAPAPTPDGTASPAVIRESAVQTLQELAHITRGRYFQARDTAALLDACRRIDRLERTDIQSFQYRRYHEAYPWLALASFLLYGLALALDMTLWRRLP